MKQCCIIVKLIAVFVGDTAIAPAFSTQSAKQLHLRSYALRLADHPEPCCCCCWLPCTQSSQVVSRVETAAAEYMCSIYRITTHRITSAEA